MNTSTILKSLLVSGIILTAFPALAGDDIESIVRDGSFFGEMRYRYETVDQDGPAPIVDDAKAAANIDQLIEQRKAARKVRDYQVADGIRDQLAKLGVVVEDRADDVFWYYEDAGLISE